MKVQKKHVVFLAGALVFLGGFLLGGVNFKKKLKKHENKRKRGTK